MTKLLFFSAISSVLLSILYLVYILIKSDTNFKLRRYYLLVSTVFVILTPLLNTNINIVKPIKQKVFQSKNISNETFKNYSALTHDIGKISIPMDYNVELPETRPPSVSKPFDYLLISSYIFIIGCCVFLLIFLFKVTKIILLILKCQNQKWFNQKIYISNQQVHPCSFFNFIIIPSYILNSKELTEIFAHEKAHSSQKHTLDIILSEIVLILQWYNPVAWHFRKNIKYNHEYLADQTVVNNGCKIPDYQELIINLIIGKFFTKLASCFNHLFIKQRVLMLQNPVVNKNLLFKGLIIATVCFSIFYSLKNVESNSNSLYCEAQKQFSEGKYNIALENINKALLLRFNTLEYLTLRANIYKQTNEILKAYLDYGLILNIDPSNTDALAQKSLISCLLFHDTTTAIGGFSRIIEIDSTNAFAYFCRNALTNSGNINDYKNSSDFKQGLKFLDDYSNAFTLISDLENETVHGAATTGKFFLNTAIESNQSNITDECYRYAEKFLNKALEINPSEELALTNLAFIYDIWKKDTDTAKELYFKAIDKNINNYEAVINLKKIAKKLKNPDEKFRIYERLNTILNYNNNQKQQITNTDIALNNRI